ncbi:uncharacterized protein LOC130817486 isoform X5 [Amaranthus tricolor]|uniref:uncharacterized protein LOC130817486 isoform X5 n=1 Tax=Amaranthus tricolor TaxID=29722 RepID=UPI002582CBE6|nr:uncharacterized protein LOC130817486 isoform X5 [Amaranthus tricolor]
MILIVKNMKTLVVISISIGVFLFALSSPSSASIMREEECKAWLVQSIPTDMPHLSLVPGVLSTADVFRWLAGNSTKKLDIMAQYWQLVAGSDNSLSGDYGYSKEEMESFGAEDGSSVYKAIEDAADRNVKLRLLQHSGVYPDFTKEISDLTKGRQNVENVTLLLGKWWGSGIVHAKVWISDDQDVYIGSANNDWKSLTQVKEVGIYIADCPKIAKKVELSFGTFQTDEQAWMDTIRSVGAGYIVRISTMDWLGQSQFTEQTVYWSSLSSAISEVVFSKKATVKLLVARWAHMINNTDQYLKSLLYTNVLCHSSTYNHCSGKVEIKYYEVPGYNSTGPAFINGTRTGNLYPAYTRVNHGKYAVSDVRAHIGTSNLVWDYFYATAGVSFGTYNPAIVSQLQQIFDADWNSPYAFPVQPLQVGESFSSW